MFSTPRSDSNFVASTEPTEFSFIVPTGREPLAEAQKRLMRR